MTSAPSDPPADAPADVPADPSWPAVLAGYLALLAVFLWILGPVVLVLGVVIARTEDPAHRSSARRARAAVVAGALSSLALLITITIRLATS